MLKRSFPFIFALLFFLSAGCASKRPTYSELIYPATSKTQVVFQGKDVPGQCTVFAQLIVHTPAGLTGKQIGDRLTGFAQNKGADMIYVGLSRKSTDDPGKDFEFSSYGPKQPYKFSKDWLGWKFGYEDWEAGGSVIGFGYNSWHDGSAVYDFSLKIQAALLRCQPGSPIKEK